MTYWIVNLYRHIAYRGGFTLKHSHNTFYEAEKDEAEAEYFMHKLYRDDLDPSELPAGTYEARIQCGTFDTHGNFKPEHETKKLRFKVKHIVEYAEYE